MDLVTFRIVTVGYMYVQIYWTSPLILPLKQDSFNDEIYQNLKALQKMKPEILFPILMC